MTGPKRSNSEVTAFLFVSSKKPIILVFRTPIQDRDRAQVLRNPRRPADRRGRQRTGGRRRRSSQIRSVAQMRFRLGLAALANVVVCAVLEINSLI